MSHEPLEQLRFLFWHGEIKRRAFVGLCFRPDASPMAGEDAPDEGQTHAGSFKFIFAVQAFEDTKELV